MSVDYRACIIDGWKITREQYNSLPDEIIDEYGYQTDLYTEHGEYYIGEICRDVSEGRGTEINSAVYNELSDKTYEDLRKVLPEVVDEYYPSLYLCLIVC